MSDTCLVCIGTSESLLHFFLKNSLQPTAARSRSRTNIAQEVEAEASSQESLQELMPEEVLVISLGTGPQTVPGMMSENEVM